MIDQSGGIFAYAQLHSWCEPGFCVLAVIALLQGFSIYGHSVLKIETDYFHRYHFLIQD